MRSLYFGNLDPCADRKRLLGRVGICGLVEQRTIPVGLMAERLLAVLAALTESVDAAYHGAGVAELTYSIRLSILN